MSLPNSAQKCQNKNSLLSFTVLSPISTSGLLTIPSPSPDYQLLYQSKKKTAYAFYRVQVPKSRLQANL